LVYHSEVRMDIFENKFKLLRRIFVSTGIPQCMEVIHSMKTIPKVKIHKSKMMFSLLYILKLQLKFMSPRKIAKVFIIYV
jgi:hypothetical protein